jgi:mannose-6-phosphate isomerase-like protein (cupin superfamily)
MKKLNALIVSVLILCSGAAVAMNLRSPVIADGYVIERDAEVAKNEPGPHDGGGPSTAYVFFDKVPDLKFSFRKRVLHKGAAIGYHLQETDEVYYMLNGTGKMTINGKEFPVKGGDAILTRAGNSHGLVQTGDGDLSIVISFQKSKN